MVSVAIPWKLPFRRFHFLRIDTCLYKVFFRWKKINARKLMQEIIPFCTFGFFLRFSIFCISRWIKVGARKWAQTPQQDRLGPESHSSCQLLRNFFRWPSCWFAKNHPFGRATLATVKDSRTVMTHGKHEAQAQQTAHGTWKELSWRTPTAMNSCTGKLHGMQSKLKGKKPHT